jgi:hypothetical protein
MTDFNENKTTFVISAYIDRIRQLEAKTQMALGVGDGSGQSFVHGDYESIKAAQKIIFDSEEKTRRIRQLETHIEELQNKIDGEKTCACSYDNPGDVCSFHSPKLKAADERIRQLEDALRFYADKNTKWSELDEDNGKIARRALEAKP